METGFVVLLIVAMLVGVFLGIFISRSRKTSRKTSRETQGVIYAYYDNTGNNPSLLLEYSVPIDDIASRKQVTFDVAVIR